MYDNIIIMLLYMRLMASGEERVILVAWAVFLVEALVVLSECLLDVVSLLQP